MKKIKLSSLSNIDTLSSTDDFILYANSIMRAGKTNHSAVSKSILNKTIIKTNELYSRKSSGNLFTGFSTWTLGPHWSIDANGNLVNNTVGEMYMHTTTNNFSIANKIYILSVEITDVDGMFCFQLHDGTTSPQSFNLYRIGFHHFMFYVNPANYTFRVFGNIGNRIKIKSAILSEMNMIDMPLIIKTIFDLS